MANGQSKPLRDLRPGDRVLVMNSDQQIVEDEVILMLDSQPNRPGFNLNSVPLRISFFSLSMVFSSILFDRN